MRTGLIQDWVTNPTEIGPMYPFVGWELPMYGVCVLGWLLFTVWQLRAESREYRDEQVRLSDPGELDAAIERGADG